VPRLRADAVITLVSLNAFMAWRGTLSSPYVGKTVLDSQAAPAFPLVKEGRKSGKALGSEVGSEMVETKVNINNI
jgi:hypothetical protein